MKGVAGQVFAIGLATSWPNATSFFRRPSLLWKSILARNMIMPIVAFLLIKAFSLRGPVAIAGIRHLHVLLWLGWMCISSRDFRG